MLSSKQLKKLNELTDQYVPNQGKADLFVGELLRAYNRIAYRWYNDGDFFFKDYGVETAGSPACFLMSPEAIRTLKQVRDPTIVNYYDSRISDLINDMIGDERDYGKNVDELGKNLLKFLSICPVEFFELDNHFDMWSWSDEAEDAFSMYSTQDEEDDYY